MKITSPVFEHNGSVPPLYTCDDQNISPPLSFSDIPPETKSLALIVDDPDAPAGTWTHWTMWNIPPATSEIPENAQPAGIQVMGATEGINSFGKPGWGGPCPPSGVHRYIFKLFALNSLLTTLSQKSDVKTLGQAMEGHVLAQSELIGLYQRLTK